MSHARRVHRVAAAAALLTGVAPPLGAQTPSTGRGGWLATPAPVETEFRGLAAIGEDTAWAVGRNGTWAVTTSAGERWRTGTIPGADSLFLVDVHATSADRAWVLGTHFEGGLARIYRTEDGGATWEGVFEDARPGAFYDGLAFWADGRGVAFGDAADGRLAIVRSEDGLRWTPATTVPLALDGEAGFAASGGAIAVAAGGHAWIGTGGGDRARVYRTDDAGHSWEAVDTPLPGGRTSGIFAVAFRDTLRGVAVGGDYTDTTSTALNVLRTRDGGRSWELVSRSAPSGVRYGVAWVPGSDPARLVAVGPSGTGWSDDFGETWTPVDRTGYNAVAFTRRSGWVAGVGGRVARWP